MLRLQTYIKNNANKTKSEVIDLYHQGRILVNGEIIPLPTYIKDSDVVTLDGIKIEMKRFVYYLYNKPVGIECTNDLNKENNIRKHLSIKERVYTVGRLDKDSRGLIILTNDNLFCNSIINHENNIEKEYVVTVENEISEEFITNIGNSIVLRGKATKECRAKKIDDYHFSIILKEGKYRQIRKMVIYNHNRVVDLKRIRIGNLSIDKFNIKEDELIEIENMKEML